VTRLIFLAGLMACVAAADAERGQRVGVADAQRPASVAPRDPVPAAPRDTVDSLWAARHATVLDTRKLPPLPPPVRRPDSARTLASDSAGVATDSSRAPAGDSARVARRDSVPPRRAVSPRLGRNSGARHPAFRDAGSPLDSLWPVKGPEPLPGSILPAKRIVAFYGNPLSTRMGILGAYPPDEMLRKLDSEVAAWNRVDPGHPVQPALHLIVEVANAHPGPNGKYRTRHDSALVEKVYGWARSRNALLFLDLQVGRSTLQEELPWVERFLVRPDVHLGIDPEFSMKKGGIPGQRVGTYDAADINFATRFLANLVEKHDLPPKILVVHRFTPAGVTNTRKIALDPRVQIVMDMDGFGPPWVKRDTYWRDIKREPVQFTGWKQFTRLRNDNPPTPRGDILRLWPVPLYIQLQ
jgi:hypothetical protein